VLQSGPCEILAAEDGNTLLVQQGQYRFRVRLIGVRLPPDADEQHARDELSRLAPAGPASIELDKRRSGADGSWLAYVYVNESLVNAQMLSTGRAVYEVYPGDSFAAGRRLKEAQSEARRNQRGIWQAAE
jgi:endonuclease YncB( thermonuclease family)